MKRFIAFLCMLTCVFGLTACGGEDTMNMYQTEKVALAEQYAVGSIIPMMEESVVNEGVLDVYYNDAYTAEEWETAILGAYNVAVEGDAFTKGLESFLTAQETMGAITGTGEVTSKVDDEEIIVYVDVIGELKNGQVELIFSNDYFVEVKSCTLNVDATFGELMAKAGMNTLLGMGSVFAVLILIMFIIEAFNLIPKLQASFSAKKEGASAPKAAVPAPVAAPVVEEIAEEADDLELVAVIAAAIAAYEGQTSTDGFVVRSIKKSRRR